MFEDACSVDELVEGRPTVVRVKGREIAVVRWRGEVHAVRNICPHQTQAFTTGNVRSTFRPSPGRFGDLVADERDPVLTCPVHGWAFALRTGSCTVDDSLRIRRYATRTQDGRLQIDVSS
jgi:3-phenylpropionate/trans-cinnamate dioxygenase ferredoxin subunit